MPSDSLFPNPVKSVLFVCTGNCSRSVMAAAICQSLLPSFEFDLQIESAGTDAKPGLCPTESTVKILKQFNVPLADHRAKTCSPELIQKADVIFVMETYHRERLLRKHPDIEGKIFLLADFCPGIEPWIQKMGIPDPLGMSFSFYENVYQMIDKSCRAVLEQIKTHTAKKT